MGNLFLGGRHLHVGHSHRQELPTLPAERRGPPPLPRVAVEPKVTAWELTEPARAFAAALTRATVKAGISFLMGLLFLAVYAGGWASKHIGAWFARQGAELCAALDDYRADSVVLRWLPRPEARVVNALPADAQVQVVEATAEVIDMRQKVRVKR